MKNYSGNREPYVYVYLSSTDEAAGRGIIEALSGAGHRLYCSSGFTERDRRVLGKAAACVLIVSSASLDELSPVVNAAVKEERPMIPVFLDALTLPPGLRMLLGPKQVHRRGDFPDEESFARALLDSPVLSSLSLTPGQKKAARNRLLAGVGAAAAAALALLLSLTVGGAFVTIRPDSALGQLGLSGSASAVKSVFLYGETLHDGMEDYGAQDIETGEELSAPGIYLPGEGITVARGALRQSSDFAQLGNLRELALSGNALEDLSPLWSLRRLRRLDLSCNLGPVSLEGIGALRELESLNLCYCEISGGWEELSRLPKLRTLYISSEDLPRVAALAAGGVELRTPAVMAESWEELKAASQEPWVYSLCFRGDDFHIPAGESLTVRENVHFGSDLGGTLNNYGSIELYGYWGMGMTQKNNYGSVTVHPGGIYACGMGDSNNYGRFTVEEGGTLELARGEQFYQHRGSLTVEGMLRIAGGGSLQWLGGEIVNNGRIESDKPESVLTQMLGRPLTDITGSGEMALAQEDAETGRSPIPTAEELDAIAALPDDPMDAAALDEFGMTPRERAYYDAWGFQSPDGAQGLGPEALVGDPYVDAESYMVLPAGGEAYLARSMCVEHRPLWVNGFTHLYIAPGAAVTLRGNDWIYNLSVTILPGGELIVDGDVRFLSIYNGGSLTVNGSLREIDAGGGIVGSSGLITVNGSLVAGQFFRFAGAEESGLIKAGRTVDRTDMEAPLFSARGSQGLERFAQIYNSGSTAEMWWE